MNTFGKNSSIQLVDSDAGNSDLGIRFRKTRPGPELDLVESFLRGMPLHIPRGSRATLFREPRLESGFPDLVIVVWRESTTREWQPARAFLTPQDLRVMHFLHQTQRAQNDELLSYFGSRALESIDRLRNATMIRQVGTSWVPYTLRRTFAASKIIAIEAKIGKWSAVLSQALLNTWFASGSYVLVPGWPSDSQLAAARRFGVGLCSLNDRGVQEVACDSMRLPRSYASWMLNDLAWRSFQYSTSPTA